MKILKELPGGILLIESPRFQDERGGFMKLFNHDTPLHKYAIAQVNYVQNRESGILRGLHFQKGGFAESKFFRVLTGQINLVYLDVNPESTTYQLSGSYILDQAQLGLLIPEGFATGYEVLTPHTDVLYYSNKDYHPEAEGGVNWQHPLVVNHWKTNMPIVSEKDKNWPL
ncbi:dTDP-4-dehydrorhamnose 3,5-epimerase family protein [Reichenbachiella agarivorans]|uniref:dTDP-4-dehydrorhamnose 3,5-epimerase n=1 Tax=Reichenbachiella agarivorans TaxID=2979464 RepID=A0ABY6CR19_9BACT|nr:dTDP-4-dehydrorhamnose 3,5-epimerase family protein [Reichenbachiella agarivorans]UXP32941.1 dTDP-4-dehydrorhamnose 3,5-epimerase family protein [Reichenbachiella agarivorans]